MKQITITEQLNGDYFTFYDNALGTILREFEGLDYASVRESIDDVAGPYGSVYVNAKHGRRVVSIRGDFVGSDIFANRRLALKALRLTGTIKLIQFTTYDDMAMRFEGEITKYINPYNHKVHTFLLEITAPDWRIYSETLKVHEMELSVIRGGTSIPTAIPMSIPSSTSGGTEVNNILTNEGNEATDPVMTLHGPGTNFTITNITANKTFNLLVTLNDTDEVIIDVKARTVIKNGVDNLYPDITGDFWSILPGENELRFLVDSGLTEITCLELSYRDAYNGL